MEVEVGNDFGIEQTDGVRRHRITEARMKLLGNRCPAYYVTTFENFDFFPGLSQVRGADQAVMTTAYNECV